MFDTANSGCSMSEAIDALSNGLRPYTQTGAQLDGEGVTQLVRLLDEFSERAAEYEHGMPIRNNPAVSIGGNVVALRPHGQRR